MPEGWYSATQQFSPPWIHYVPVVTEPTFAICEFGDDSTLEFAQFPQNSMLVRGSISAVSENETFYAIINTKGKMGDSCDAADTGPEFNPLFETDKYGNPNKFQDPSRGRIPNIPPSEMIPGSSPAEFASTLLVSKVLQNLEGTDSLIGRSITLFDAHDDRVACCVIGRDMDPRHMEPEMPEQFASTLDGSDTVMQNLEGTDSLIGRSITLFDASDDTIVACCVIGRDMAPMVEEPEMPEPMPMPMPMPVHDEPDMSEHEPHGYNPHHGGHHYNRPQYEPRHFRPEFNH